MKVTRKINLHNYDSYEETVDGYKKYCEKNAKNCLIPHKVLSFADWCNKFVSQVKEIKPGQWFLLKNIKLGSDADIVRVDSVSDNEIHFTNGDFCTSDFAVMALEFEHQVIPLAINPWSLSELEKVMSSHTKIRLFFEFRDSKNDTCYITDICKSENDEYPMVSLSNGKSYDSKKLTRIAETEDHKPFGYPVEGDLS